MTALPRVTNAAEGLPRRRWLVSEIEAMVEAGILLEDERFELIGGEVVPMSPKGSRHEVVKKELNRFWVPRLGPAIDLVPETTLRYAPDGFLEPDFLFWPRRIPITRIAATNALLVVEVADTSLGYDLGRKAALYAGLGLRELWVIDARRLVTHVHRAPAADGYGERHVLAAAEPLVPHLLPDLAVTLADLPLDDLGPDEGEAPDLA